MFKDVKELKDLLNELGYTGTVVLENPSYLNAIIGITDEGALCYSYEKMIECLMEEDKMEEKKTVEEQPKKFTYEQLEQIAGNLSNQVQQLSVKLQEANMINVFKRLDYLFKVVETSSNLVFSSEFVDRCVKEIEELMTPINDTEEQKEE